MPCSLSMMIRWTNNVCFIMTTSWNKLGLTYCSKVARRIWCILYIFMCKFVVEVIHNGKPFSDCIFSMEYLGLVFMLNIVFSVVLCISIIKGSWSLHLICIMPQCICTYMWASNHFVLWFVLLIVSLLGNKKFNVHISILNQDGKT